MAYSNIDATLSEADVQAVKDLCAEILAKLPFLINLTVPERRRTTKTGPVSMSFVENALATARVNKHIFPSTFNTDEFARDVELFAMLSDIQAVVDSVASQIDDTRLAVGGEAMQAATQTYKYVKTAAKTTPGLRPVAERLGERFEKAKRRRGSGESGSGDSGENQE